MYLLGPEYTHRSSSYNVTLILMYCKAFTAWENLLHTILKAISSSITISF